LDADTSIETFVNIYNFSKSAWEPLIEPWQLGFHMSKTVVPEKLSIDLYSRKMLEVTITSQTIALLTKAAQFMRQDEDMLTKPRGSETPFRIHNQTGYPLHVWAASENFQNNASMAIKLQDGETAPWRFEEWEKMRENLTPEGASGIVGIKLENSPFESIKEISVNREGEQLYTLRPAMNDVLHRLLCEVRLGADSIKHITFRSPFLIENNTQIPVEMGILDRQGKHLIKVYKILPGESQPAPVEAAYHQAVVIRPDAGFGYTWSGERLFWRDLLKRPTRGITCKADEGNNAPPFYFQMHAKYQKNNPVTRHVSHFRHPEHYAKESSQYPYMKVRLFAPVEIQNLLPYDFTFRIYDKNTEKEWKNFLRKGGLSPVHVVELSHLLLMSIEMQDTPYSESEFAIINSNDTEFDAEKVLITKDNQGLELRLKIHYYKIPDSGGAFRAAVYSPYVILNKTGLNMMVKSKSLLQSAQTAAGQIQTGSTATQKALPYMFSYPNDDRQNRAVFKVGDSSWSRPQSFEAIGSINDVVLPSSTKQTEIHIGITVDEGEGKYKMTKVVTLTPRFVLKSNLSETIQVREPGSGSTGIMTLEPGQRLPLHFLRATQNKQLTLMFPGINNKWSAPFNISNLGSEHVKLYRHGQRQTLLRVDILLEKATIFLHISVETKNWPFSIRNESTQEFTFWQADPNEDDTEDIQADFRPIVYKLPPRSIMPYAWDYPAGRKKELVLSAGRQTRHVPLTEIGNLLPIKITTTGPDGRLEQKIIDVNVIANGPTQTLVLSNYKQSKSIYKVKSQTSSTNSLSTVGFEVKDIDSSTTFQVQIRFAGIGISLINRQLKELAYITLRDLEFKYGASSLYTTYNLVMKWVQIDNQLYGGIFPIIFYPSVVPKTGKEMDVHPCVHAGLTLVNDDSYGVTYIKYASILFQQMTIELDEDFIYALLDFTKLPGMETAERNEGKLCDDSLDIPEPKLVDGGRDLYFELLNIQPAQLDLSFLRTDVVNVEDKTSSNNPLMFVVNILTMAIGNINDAPLKLNALMLENARVSVPVLFQRLQAHYTQEILYQIHKILGSADFLGNPVGLFNNISSGVVDIFYEPYQGFMMTDRPQDLGIGIAKGATMFVKKSVFGVSDSLSKFTGSISKGMKCRGSNCIDYVLTQPQVSLPRRSTSNSKTDAE
jgi:vacuolar protein sorting-associated protein 13A/C